MHSLDDGNYRAILTNVSGAVTSSVARLYALSTPVISSSGQPRNWPVVSLGASVSNRVVVASSVAVSYQWRRNGEPLPGQTKSTIVLPNLEMTDAGDYDVLVVNNCGGTNSATVKLAVDPTFIKITDGPVVTDVRASSCASWFDYDNDGDLDLFVAVWSSHPCSLYQNNGDGTFTRITNALTQSQLSDAHAAQIADFDNDGWLDLFLVRVNTSVRNLLFRNAGNGNWARLPDSSFDSPCIGSSDGACVDYDGDGFVDLFDQNGYAERVNDALYRNLGNGIFHKVPAAECGLGSDNAEASGCAWSDYDHDGWPDVFLAQGYTASGGAAVDTSGLFHNDGHGMFSRVNDTGIQMLPGTWLVCPSAIDYDSDGLSDLFLTTWPTNSVTTPRLALLYRNLGNGTFTDVSSSTGILLTQDGWGGEIVNWGDYDNDGFIDFLDLPFSRDTGPGFPLPQPGRRNFRSVNVGSPWVDGSFHQNLTWAELRQ